MRSLFDEVDIGLKFGFEVFLVCYCIMFELFEHVKAFWFGFLDFWFELKLILVLRPFGLYCIYLGCNNYAVFYLMHKYITCMRYDT